MGNITSHCEDWNVPPIGWLSQNALLCAWMSLTHDIGDYGRLMASNGTRDCDSVAGGMASLVTALN